MVSYTTPPKMLFMKHSIWSTFLSRRAFLEVGAVPRGMVDVLLWGLNRGDGVETGG